MRRTFFVGAALLFTMIIFGGCGDDHAKTEADSTQGKTESGTVTKAQFPIERFEDPSACATCHNIMHDEWSGSMHSNALKDPIYRKAVALASRETYGDIDVYCSKCHGPIAVMTGEVPPVDGSQAGDTSLKGVQCDFCHTVSKATGIGNGAFESEPGNNKRGPFTDSQSYNHVNEYSVLLTKGEFCGMCHNVNHPGNGLRLESTYTEWKEGPYAKEGIQCQDCHMTPGPGVEKKPGMAVDYGPERPNIFTHDIAGGNFAVAGIMGSEAHAKLAEQRLKAAASIEFVDETVKRTGDSLAYKVKVSNIGAGHYLPTGLTEMREMWLEVTARDSSGKILWQSGQLDNKGNINRGTVIFNTVILDKYGQQTDKVWKAAKISSDGRIAPKGSRVVNYSVESGVPGGKLTLTARLLYRSAPQRVINDLFKKESFKVPVLEMTKASINVY